MSNKPQDILPDEINAKEIQGVQVRKGTVGAVLVNAEILSSTTASLAEKTEAMKTIEELAPALVALGLHKHVTWKNPEIQKLVDSIVLKNSLVE